MKAADAYGPMLAELYGRRTRGIKPGLETMVELLDALGNPHAGRRFVIVAGTNAKGSTSRFIAAAAGTSDYPCKVGLFTSPHLLRFTERIQIGGREISDADTVRAWEQVRAVEKHCTRAPTFFECTTAMALWLFAEARVDVAVLEVGLGGRLDSTNVIDATQNRISVITPISVDHTAWLGKSIAEIAAEKAAVIPWNGIAISAPQSAEAQSVIEQVCAERSATLLAGTWRDVGGRLLVKGPVAAALDFTLHRPAPVPDAREVTVDASRHPRYQRDNIAVAWATLNVLQGFGVRSDPDQFARTIGEVELPGRFQWVDDGFLVDAAHNPAAVRALLESVQHSPRATHTGGHPKPLHAVFTALADKDADRMLDLLAGACVTIDLCPLDIERNRSADALYELVAARSPRHPNVRLRVAQSPLAAYHQARHSAEGSGGIVLGTGSIFLVSELLKQVVGVTGDPPIAL